MADIQPYDANEALRDNLRETHRDWQQLRDQSTSGQKAFLTQMKNHYLAIVREDPDAAAEKLAMYEYKLSLVIRKHGKDK